MVVLYSISLRFNQLVAPYWHLGYLSVFAVKNDTTEYYYNL